MKVAGRGADPLRLRGGLAQGEVRAPPHGDPRPVRRPHHPAQVDLLRPRPRGPRRPSPTRSARPSRRCWPRPAREAGATHHVGGTYVCIEGPQFSTRAESELYRSWGMDVIGMTNLQEAQARPRGGDLLRHPGHGHRLRLLASRATTAVTVEQVIANLGSERGHGQGGAAGGAAPASADARATASAPTPSSTPS